ncbi:MAG: SUMF1/EgtB/PvdO family nonheme iron enzyme [Treponema sp.]|jgi:formylglycine-generating enzyme required for sulfatase activity/TolB-like protein|nr:SUMF1/EgtB/PvdO family nonheme iron enzyme [Treponema sp.]
MKKILCVLLLSALAMGLAAQAAAPAAAPFDAAIGAAVRDVAAKVPEGAALAIPEFEVAKDARIDEQARRRLKDYFVTELSAALVNMGTFKVLERQKINLLTDSLVFDASGLVSNESAQRIGQSLGVAYLVAGSLKGQGDDYRLSVEVVEVAAAQKSAPFSQAIPRSELNRFFAQTAWSVQGGARPASRTFTTSDTGVYVGIISFGALTTDLSGGAPVFLDETGVKKLTGVLDSDYRKDGKPGTALYYAAHRALASLSANVGRYPPNLDGVYMITITDGIDTSSTGFDLTPIENKNFSGGDDREYLEYLKTQLVARPVYGRPLTAYSTGVRGSDVTDVDAFQTTLQALASEKNNFYELSRFSDLNGRFDAIAKDLTITTETITFELKASSLPAGTQIRMTFDGAASAEASQVWFEATVEADIETRSFFLRDIQYQGTASSSGPEVPGVNNGNEVIYIFNDFTGYGTGARVRQWIKRNGSDTWTPNSEYSVGNTMTKQTEYKSAVVYLVLDASSSLSDDDINAVRNAAKEFLKMLYERSTGKTAPSVSATPSVPAPAPQTPPAPQAPQALPAPQTAQPASTAAAAQSALTPAPAAAPAPQTVQSAPAQTAPAPAPQQQEAAQPAQSALAPAPALALSAAFTAPAEDAAKAPSDMVRIQGGTFTMGDPSAQGSQGTDASPHQVTLSSFSIGRYEVTQKQWQEIMGTNPSFFKGNNLPVENVSWYDCIEYCNKRSEREGLTPVYTIDKNRIDPNNQNPEDAYRWLVTWNRSANGYRLPTEAEWEYACRAGTTGRFNTGASISPTLANYRGSNASGSALNNGTAEEQYRERTMPVGSFAPSPWGLYDMHGNVWEWCWDWYGAYPGGTQTDPSGAAQGTLRIFRGGSWGSIASYCEAAFRYYYFPSSSDHYLGFRVVCS